ncbi:MAG: T9SS type A sorting domain-containing protein [Bacteroidota bacterium]|nr:T9SS type A sorting domain-containing protein [Bacteroidota bacterium]
MLLLQNPKLIPSHGATKQPAWAFPIWIEDGSGQKDSLYVGYDPSSSNQFGGFYWSNPPSNEGAADTIFGEYWLTKPSSGFFTSIGSWNDSISKINITPEFASLNIILYNAIWPITIKYDVGLFYADTLPFTDTIKPEGYAEFHCIDSWPDSDFNCFTQGPTYYLTDSTHNYFGSNWKVMPISFVLTGDNATTSPNGMGIEIMFKDFYSLLNQVSIKEITDENFFNLFPNPAKDVIIVEVVPEDSFNITILDYSGRTVLVKNNLQNKSSVPIFILDSGIYFVKVSTSKHTNIIKLIKH